MDLLPSSTQGFPKTTRLLSAKDYAPVFNQATLRLSNHYLLLLVINTERSNSRLGIVVAKKNIPLAVQRNRIKRILRESFRIRRSSFATIDLVVLVRKGLDRLESRDIRSQIDSLFEEISKKIGVSNNQDP